VPFENDHDEEDWGRGAQTIEKEQNGGSGRGLQSSISTPAVSLGNAERGHGAQAVENDGR
jgi:hypothetical protein